MKTLLSPENKTSVPRSTAPEMAKYYPADRLVKYLHLQAEIEFLLQEVQNLKQHKS